MDCGMSLDRNTVAPGLAGQDRPAADSASDAGRGGRTSGRWGGPRCLRWTAAVIVGISGFGWWSREAGAQIASDVSRVGFVADVQAVVPETLFHLAVVVRLRDGWHTYWEHPGDSGAPPVIDVEAPDGFTVGAVRFPRPETFSTPEETTFGYAREAVFFIPVSAPVVLPSSPLRFRIRCTYLVCLGQCLIGEASGEVLLPPAAAGTTAARTAGPDGDLLDRHFRRLPQPIERLSGITLQREPGALIASGSTGGFTRMRFLPSEVSGVVIGDVHTTPGSEGRFTLRIQYEVRAQNLMPGTVPAIRGLLLLGDRPDDPAYQVHVPLPHPNQTKE